MKKLLILVLLMINAIAAFAQNNGGTEMADALRSSGKIYVVISVICIIFAGLAIFLFSIDRRLKKIEKIN
ncbi:MAG: CcmD family protein [Mucilaginibacter sp.]